jgi:hypothetical protein
MKAPGGCRAGRLEESVHPAGHADLVHLERGIPAFGFQQCLLHKLQPLQVGLLRAALYRDDRHHFQLLGHIGTAAACEAESVTLLEHPSQDGDGSVGAMGWRFDPLL